MFKFLITTARKLHLAGPAELAKAQVSVKAKPVVRGTEAPPRTIDNRMERGAKEYRRPPMIF